MSVFDAMRKQWQDAYNKGDLKAIGELYTSDASYFATDGHVDEGRQAIVAARQKEHDELARQLEGQPFQTKIEVLEHEEFGDAAFEIGRHTATTPDGRVLSQGRYMALAKKVGGEWKLTRHMTTGVLPVALLQEQGLVGTA